MHSPQTSRKAVLYANNYTTMPTLDLRVDLSPNTPRKAHVHPPVDWFWTADLDARRAFGILILIAASHFIAGQKACLCFVLFRTVPLFLDRTSSKV